MINSGKEWDWMDNKNNRVIKWIIFDLGKNREIERIESEEKRQYKK